MMTEWAPVLRTYQPLLGSSMWVRDNIFFYQELTSIDINMYVHKCAWADTDS